MACRVVVRAVILALLVAAALACAAPSVGGPPSTTCQTDADCELVTGPPPSCCSRCEPTAMSREAAAAARKQCRASEGGDYFSRCPHLSCPCTKSVARCKQSACVVESSGC